MAVKRWRWFTVTLTCVLCVAVLAAALSVPTRFVDGEDRRFSRPRVLIDAGHGGFDGGAQATDGTKEKEINLQIARPLAAVLTVCGFEVAMTRWEDEGLEDAQSDTIRQKKVSDMNARLELYEQAQMVVSVHQNMFAAKSCQGAQIFYSTNHPCSKVLATCVREQVVSMLQPDNTRELKTGNRDIFLLYKTARPAILVECGFLSNRDELAKLKTPDYQRQLALAVARGVLIYSEKEQTI